MKKNGKWGAMALACLLAFSPQSIIADASRPVLPEKFENGVPGNPMEKPYWEIFGDAALEEIVRKGLSGNYDLRATEARIRQAEAIAEQAKAPLLPNVNATAGYTLRPYEGIRLPVSLGGPQGDDPNVVHNLSATLTASYLVDITGRQMLNRQAALYDVSAGRLDAVNQATTLLSLIVKTYFSVCQATQQLSLVEEQIETNQAFLELVEAQFDVGVSTAVDVLQQRQQLEGVKSRLPLVEMIARTNKQQLAALIGETDISKLPAIPTKLPDDAPLPPTGTPERLLTSRADLRAKSVRIEALLMREKSAVRTLLPSLTLNGSVGYGFTYDRDSDHGETWSLGALFSVPLFQGGANRAAIDQARASTQTEVFALQQAVIFAVAEVESSLSMITLQKQNLGAIESQLDAARTTFEEARKRYAVGLSNYLTVLTALAGYQQVQLSRLQAKFDVLSSSITLMNALGGEWTRTLISNRIGREP